MDKLTSEEFLKDFTKSTYGKILIGLLSILGILLVSWIVISLYNDKKQSDDLIEREINGILINSKDITHGKYALIIKQHGTGEEIKYYLHISKFFQDNNIQVGDSISKNANSHTINFFKKRNGTFNKCCELYWY